MSQDKGKLVSEITEKLKEVLFGLSPVYAQMPKSNLPYWSSDTRELLDTILKLHLYQILQEMLERWNARISSSSNNPNTIISNLAFNPAFLEWFTKLDDKSKEQVLKAIAMLTAATNPQTAFMMSLSSGNNIGNIVEVVREILIDYSSRVSQLTEGLRQFFEQVNQQRSREMEFIKMFMEVFSKSNTNQNINLIDLVKTFAEIFGKKEEPSELTKKIVEATSNISNFYNNLITGISDAYSKALQSISSIKHPVSEIKELAGINPDVLNSITKTITELVKSNVELQKVIADTTKEVEKFKYDLQKDFLEFENKMRKRELLFKHELKRRAEVNKLLENVGKVIERVDVDKIVDKIFSRKSSEGKVEKKGMEGKKTNFIKLTCNSCNKPIYIPGTSDGKPIPSKVFCPLCGKLIYSREEVVESQAST